jgi:hypothetical protein
MKNKTYKKLQLGAVKIGVVNTGGVGDQAGRRR